MPERIAFRKKGRGRTFIKEWRQYRKLSQEQLGEILNTSVASISRIESGTQPYTQDVIEALAEALGTSTANLLLHSPLEDEQIWLTWEKATGDQRVLIEELARSVVKNAPQKKA